MPIDNNKNCFFQPEKGVSNVNHLSFFQLFRAVHFCNNRKNHELNTDLFLYIIGRYTYIINTCME